MSADNQPPSSDASDSTPSASQSTLPKTGNRLSRRRLLLGSCFAGLASSAALGFNIRIFEPSNFEITRKEIGHCFRSGIRRGMTFLHLSDFHCSREVSMPMIEKAVAMALEHPADAAFLTGDFITWKIDDPERYRQVLRMISSRMPTYACLGNHDGGGWAVNHGGYSTNQAVRDFLESCEINVLVNEQREIFIHDQPIHLIGLGDLWAKDHRPETVMPRIHESGETPFEKPVLVLSHNPDMKIAMHEFDWDLMLSGHTHGGQLVVPFTGHRPFIPVYDTSHPEGLKKWHNRRWIHITRGVGNRHSVRFNCRPEISFLST